MKKKILILAYDFPPYNSIGSQRPSSWFKYFKRFNLEPIIITRHWDKISNADDYYKPSNTQKVTFEKNEYGTIIRVPFKPSLRDKLIAKKGIIFKIIRKGLSLINGLFQYYFPQFDNRYNLYQQADKELLKGDIDYIAVTVEPYIFLKYGYLLSKKHDIKWIADYRDEWTTNSIHSSDKLLSLQFKWFLKSKENKWLQSASLITSASTNYSERLSQFLNKEVKTIFNGYFPDDFKELPEIRDEGACFEISYIGSLYNYQPLELFLDAFKEFIKTKSNVKLVFYGANFNSIEQQRILKHDSEINKFITTTDRFERPELYKKLKYNSSVFLILANPDEIRIPGKIFDYLALKRPILLVQDDKSVLSEIILKTKSGKISSEKQQIVKALVELYNSKSEITPVRINEYSREFQTNKFVELILNC